MGAGGEVDDDEAEDVVPSTDDIDLMVNPNPGPGAGAGAGCADTKLERGPDATPSTVDSTPEPDVDVGASQEPAQPPRRKGGRKPIYATSEERKQRNRQAQAAFRERRTEYIKQLEATIKQNEETLTTLQQSHRSAADECLMLRYKNSLLERILLEKGIDVQAELQMKAGSPLGLQHPAANIPHVPQIQPPLQRTAVQRHHARRSVQSFLPKITPGQSSFDSQYQTAPQGHPTPSSHASSPTNRSAKSPMMMYHGGNTPTTSAGQAQSSGQQLRYPGVPQQPSGSGSFHLAQQPLSPQTQRPLQQHRYQHSISSVSNMSPTSMNMGSTGASVYYPSPFQKHIDQLELEYDAQETRATVEEQQPDVDDSIPDALPDRMQGNYPPVYGRQRGLNDFYQPVPGSNDGQRGQQMVNVLSAPPQMPYEQQKIGHRNSFAQSMSYAGQAGQQPVSSSTFTAMDIDPNDPMLNADPFGLSASMHYPTNYTFEPAHGTSMQQPPQ